MFQFGDFISKMTHILYIELNKVYKYLLIKSIFEIDFEKEEKCVYENPFFQKKVIILTCLLNGSESMAKSVRRTFLSPKKNKFKIIEQAKTNDGIYWLIV